MAAFGINCGCTVIEYAAERNKRKNVKHKISIFEITKLLLKVSSDVATSLFGRKKYFDV